MKSLEMCKDPRVIVDWRVKVKKIRQANRIR